MEFFVKLVAGGVLLVLSLAYLYRPSFILRLNALARAFLFNDAHLLHYRRRWGLLAFLGAMLFLYSAFLNFSEGTRPPAPGSSSPLPRP